MPRSHDKAAAEDPAGVEAAWSEEIARRKRELSSGAVKPMSRDEALRFIETGILMPIIG